MESQSSRFREAYSHGVLGTTFIFDVEIMLGHHVPENVLHLIHFHWIFSVNCLSLLNSDVRCFSHQTNYFLSFTVQPFLEFFA